MASDFERLNIPVFCLDERRSIFEDRMRSVLDCLAQFKPTVVLANLGPVSFEVLRYVPPGVFRIGAIQSDDPAVYDTASHYIAVMDALAAVSATIKRKAEADVRFSGVPVKSLPYGVPMPEDLSALRGKTSGALRILYLGRLDQEQKRVRLFPEILKKLENADISFQWTVAGEGPCRPFLETNMRTVRPDQSVSIIGPVKYAEVPRLLAAHDVFLLTSDYEGLPLSLLEAMGHGLVPVVSNVESGVREMVDQTNGALVPILDVDGYARAIIHLHEHRDEMASKSAAAQSRVRTEYSVEAMTNRWLATFPKTAPTVVEWPTRWGIKPPLVARHPFYFSRPMRMLRRVGVKFRHLAFV